MSTQEFVDLINDLNEYIENIPYFENNGHCFNYRVYGFVDIICFGDFVVYCSENDSSYDYDNEVELTVKEILMKNFKEYINELNKIKL